MLIRSILFFIYCAVFVPSCHGEEISFKEISSGKTGENQRIEIRGFLYKSGDGGYVLSDTPNLRSCCIGKERESVKQMVVKGSFPTPLPTKAVLLQGVFTHTAGKPQIDQATLVESTPKGIFSSLIILGSIGLCVFLLYRKFQFFR